MNTQKLSLPSGLPQAVHHAFDGYRTGEPLSAHISVWEESPLWKFAFADARQIFHETHGRWEGPKGEFHRLVQRDKDAFNRVCKMCSYYCASWFSSIGECAQLQRLENPLLQRPNGERNPSAELLHIRLLSPQGCLLRKPIAAALLNVLYSGHDPRLDTFLSSLTAKK